MTNSVVTSKLTATAVTLLLAAVPVLTACGDNDSDRAAFKPTVTAAPASTPKGEIPTELSGTWKTTIRLSKLENPPDHLTQKRSVWTLKILGTGGTDNGPSMFLASDEIGEIVNPIGISGGHITVQDPIDCHVFTYVAEADRLTFHSPEGGCASLRDVLTARPWRRTTS